MKRILVSTILAIVTLTILGCGDGSSHSPNIVTQILSNATLDGDISKDPVSGTFIISQNSTQSVFAGINPVSGVEYRAFLDFPLTGAVPGNAIIAAATLDIFISSRLPSTGAIPMRIELVSFGSPLQITDYNSAPLTTSFVSFPVFGSDVGQHVLVDVTTLMAEAQRLRLFNFQVRILEDFGPVTPGLIEINDTTGVYQGVLAPLLEVTYF